VSYQGPRVVDEMLIDPRFHGEGCDMAEACSCGMSQNLRWVEAEAAAHADAQASLARLDLMEAQERVARLEAALEAVPSRDAIEAEAVARYRAELRAKIEREHWLIGEDFYVFLSESAAAPETPE
jgi:hypothetical protein